MGIPVIPDSELKLGKATADGYAGTDDEKNNYKNALNELVIETTRRDGKCYVETGNYLGKFNYQEMDINIQSRFSDALIKRMLNFANDIYLGDVDTFSDKSRTEDFTKFIL